MFVMVAAIAAPPRHERRSSAIPRIATCARGVTGIFAPAAERSWGYAYGPGLSCRPLLASPPAHVCTPVVGMGGRSLMQAMVAGITSRGDRATVTIKACMGTEFVFHAV